MTRAGHAGKVTFEQSCKRSEDTCKHWEKNIAVSAKVLRKAILGMLKEVDVTSRSRDNSGDGDQVGPWRLFVGL